MKKIIFVLLFANYFHAQKCNFCVNKTDDFTKKKITQTDPETIFNDFKKVKASIIRIDSIESVNLDITYSGFKVKIITDKSDVQFLMMDGSILSLKTSGSAKGNIENIGASAQITKISFSCELSKKDIETLSKGLVKKIRVGMTDGAEDFEIKEKNGKKISEMLLCSLK